jgi:hypothetical protein
MRLGLGHTYGIGSRLTLVAACKHGTAFCCSCCCICRILLSHLSAATVLSLCSRALSSQHVSETHPSPVGAWADLWRQGARTTPEECAEERKKTLATSKVPSCLEKRDGREESTGMLRKIKLNLQQKTLLLCFNHLCAGNRKNMLVIHIRKEAFMNQLSQARSFA